MASRNRLAEETSPYLRQHADNPVDWYPWGDEAFAAARERDVPVLLSVGYSACHWCHVMAHESFEDDATAAVLNESFVSIKVDREERPDVDAVYMDAVQALTGSGGWPMTVFLDPDGRPFFGGTYFPPTRTGGRPSFVELLRAVSEAWSDPDKRGELLEQGMQLATAIGARTGGGRGSADGHGHALDRSLLDAGMRQLAEAFDPQWGGFGRAPKFPQTTMLELCLRSHAHSGGADALAMVTTSLDAMASGGIYDHLGGGFARYSVDRAWLVPHFEKMLYDQAALARVYLHAWQVTGEPRYRQVVAETVGYVLRDLRHASGGFFSAEDADSEGVEGKFSVWSLDEVLSVAGTEAVDWYGVTEAGNFEGKNILHRPERGDLLRPPAVERARARLFDARAARVRPGLDDKVLTEWNAMWISALAEAGAACSEPDWVLAAVEGASFLLGHLRREDGRWLRSWQADGGARHLAYAVDVAWLVDAFTRIGEATGEARWTAEAEAAAEALLALFLDPDGGGFFTVGSDGEQLIVRQKDSYDGATPSANSVAALALLRLGALTGDERWSAAGRDVLEAMVDELAHGPMGHTHALAALDLALPGSTEIVIPGRGIDALRLVAEVRPRYLPNAVLAWGDPGDGPLWEGRSEGRAYVCQGFACKLPAATPEELAAQLSAR